LAEDVSSEIFRKLDSLPTLPNVASALMRMGAQDNVQVEEVAQLIETDPSAAARLLKIVNSAYRGLQAKVSSINRAVVMLGVNGVRNVLLSMQAMDVFGKVSGDKQSALLELWKHCLAVASAAELIAENTGGILPEDAFSAGLLHDIGKIALHSVSQDEYLEIVRTAREQGTGISEAERQRYGVTHAEAGRYLAEKWGLPEPLVRAISDHHLLPEIRDPADKADLSVAIVSLADDVVRRQRIGFSGTPESWEPIEELCRLLGLDADNIEDVVSRLVERISLRGSILDIQLPESQIYLESLRKANETLGSLYEKLEGEGYSVEGSRNRLQAIADLNSRLGTSFTCIEALSGLADTVYQHLHPKKVILYWVDDGEQQVFGTVRNGASGSEDFSISAVGGKHRNVEELTSDRDALVHVVEELAGKLSPEAGLVSIVAGRLFFMPIVTGQGQRAGILVESGGTQPVQKEDLQFFGEAGSLVLQRALFEGRLRGERAKLMDSNRRSRAFYEQLLNSRKLASIGRMAAGAAHEINNPLAIVSGRVQLLLKMEADESKRHHLEMIRSQCDRMSRIISDILTFGKPEKPAVEAVSIERAVENAMAQLEDCAREKAIRFVKEFPTHMAQAAADEAKVEQAFRNILANSVDASDKGGEITIGAELAEKDKFIAVRFADNGKGMDKGTLENIFEPFFTTKAGIGTGLGLAICHSIIASHGGKIRVRSSPGEGTAFTVLLPVWKGRQ
jgi:putative nucleotidyltransferase with HDIG domain